jgi:hypothetical protein
MPEFFDYFYTFMTYKGRLRAGPQRSDRGGAASPREGSPRGRSLRRGGGPYSAPSESLGLGGLGLKPERLTWPPAFQES